MDKYVSSTQFQTALTESIQFDMAKANPELEAKMTKIEKSVTENEKYINIRCDDSEQFSRRNDIRILGIKENLKEITNNIAIEVIKKLEIDINPSDICRSHRMGRKLDTKPRQIIVKFVRHDVKAEIMRKRRLLKDLGISIVEDLTYGRLHTIKEIKMKAGKHIHKLWIVDGLINIRTKMKPESILTIRSMQEADCVTQ